MGLPSGLLLALWLHVVAYYPIVVSGQNNELDDLLPSGLPACVRSSLTDVGDCVKDNAEGCLERCTEVANSIDKSPFDDEYLQEELFKCNGIQRNLVDPICPLTNCCQECIPKLVDALNCISQQVLKATPAPCRVRCAASTGTRRELELTAGRYIQDDENDEDDEDEKPVNSRMRMLVEEEEEFLFYSHRILEGEGIEEPQGSDMIVYCAAELSTLSGQAPTPEEMAAIMKKGDLFACLGTGAVTIAARKVAYDEYIKQTTINMFYEIPGVGLTIGQLGGIIALVILICGLCCCIYCCMKVLDGSSGKRNDADSYDDDDSY